MSGFLKVMSGQSMPDSSPYKNFDLYSIAPGGKVLFKQNSTGLDIAAISNPDRDTEEVILYGNAYMMADSGKTVASRGTNVPTTLEAEDDPAPWKIAVASLMCCSSDDGDLEKVLDEVGSRYPALFTAMAKVLKHTAYPILAEDEESGDPTSLVALAAVQSLVPDKPTVYGKSLAEIGRTLSNMHVDDIKTVLFHADNYRQPQEDNFMMAMVEYIDGEVKKGNADAFRALARAAQLMAADKSTAIENRGGMRTTGRPHVAEG